MAALVATSAPTPALASSSCSACSLAWGSSSSNTSTAASAPIPNGRSRPRSWSGSRLPPSASANRSPARRRSVSCTTRSLISSSPTTIEPWRAVRRSSSPSGPRSLTHGQPGDRRAPAPTGDGDGQRPPPLSEGAGARTGSASAAARPVRARRRAPSAPRRPAPLCSGVGRARGRPRPERSPSRRPPTPASRGSPSSPPPSITSRSRRSCTWVPRSSTAYCSLTSRAKARSVIAMNGISARTSNTGMPRLSASSRSPFGIRLCSNPVPSPSPATSSLGQQREEAALASGPVSWIVVSSSSPPDSHGVGSSSSEMCTQRIGRSAPSVPAASSRPQSATRLPTVSISV